MTPRPSASASRPTRRSACASCASAIALTTRSAKSTATNKARLRVLEAREQMLDDVFQTARKQLESVAQDGDKYAALLKNLVLQALFSLMETDVVVKGRKQDADAVKKAADEAASAFQEATGHKVKVSIESELSDDLAGGVIVTASRGKLVVNNTLDERLRLTEDRMLPEIRNQLFGPNPNRKVLARRRRTWLTLAAHRLIARRPIARRPPGRHCTLHDLSNRCE